jgi:hypothetical protein
MVQSDAVEFIDYDNLKAAKTVEHKYGCSRVYGLRTILKLYNYSLKLVMTSFKRLACRLSIFTLSLFSSWS